MKVTVYDLLGIVKDSKKDIYVKYINKTNEKEEIMWACIENIIDKLDKKLIELKDKVEILEEKGEDLVLTGKYHGKGIYEFKIPTKIFYVTTFNDGRMFIQLNEGE